MTEPTHCYLGTKPCGCFGFIAVDMPDLAQEIAQDTEWLVRAGGKVVRMEISDGRAACESMPSACGACQ